jgi:hypothetical protein
VDTTCAPYSNLFDDVVVIEGDPPAGVSVRLPADANGRVSFRPSRIGLTMMIDDDTLKQLLRINDELLQL